MVLRRGRGRAAPGHRHQHHQPGDRRDRQTPRQRGVRPGPDSQLCKRAARDPAAGECAVALRGSRGRGDVDGGGPAARTAAARGGRGRAGMASIGDAALPVTPTHRGPEPRDGCGRRDRCGRYLHSAVRTVSDRAGSARRDERRDPRRRRGARSWRGSSAHCAIGGRRRRQHHERARFGTNASGRPAATGADRLVATRGGRGGASRRATDGVARRYRCAARWPAPRWRWLRYWRR